MAETMANGCGAAAMCSSDSALDTTVAMEADGSSTNANANGMEGDSNNNNNNNSKKKKEEKRKEPEVPKFQPGDHVIRWEMLPIAWPIQVHGIVLEAYEGNVVLVDFGLTAVNQKDKSGPITKSKSKDEGDIDATANAATADASKEGGAEEGGGDEKVKRKSSMFDTKSVEEAVNSMGNSMDPVKGKNRLNIRVLADAEEIKKWKKVNYEGGLFGRGGSGGDGDDENGGKKKKKLFNFRRKNSNNSNGNSNDDQQQVDANGKRRPTWWQQMSGKFQKNRNGMPPTSGGQEEIVTTEPEMKPLEDDMESSRSTLMESLAEDEASEKPKEETEQQPTAENAEVSNDDNDATATTDNNDNDNSAPEVPASPSQQELIEQAIEQKAEKQTEEEIKKSSPEKSSSWSARAMNPAMAKLLKRNKKIPDKSGTDENENNTEKEAEAAANKKPALPKADPPKLVLARTRWLLQHGEAILPKYHCFHSNSECIAVFCKTGYWSNIQADVFLHSTAIGNAKSMGMATLGVAASVPLLAPVVGVAGLAMVGAPWLVLAKSKEKAEGFTQQLNDAFWAQAEPEVFVECIEQWTFRKEMKEKEAAAAAAAAAKAEEEGTTKKEEEEKQEVKEEKQEVKEEKETSADGEEGEATVVAGEDAEAATTEADGTN